MLHDYLESVLTMSVHFEFLFLLLGGTVLYLMQLLRLLGDQRQVGIFLMYIGALHIFSVFSETPKKIQKDNIMLLENLTDNGVDSSVLANEINALCKDNNLRIYEHRKFSKLMTASINEHVKKNGMYSIQQKNIANDGFCNHFNNTFKQGVGRG